MPNRIIRDGILRSEKISTLDPMAELFYRRLMSVVDDFGRYFANSALLLSDCFPLRPSWADEGKLANWIAECCQADLLDTYSVKGIKYLQIINFEQRIRPGSASKFPPSADSSGEQPLYAADFREAPPNAAYARASSTSTPTTAPTTTPPAAEMKIDGKPLFERLIGAFLAAGVKLSERQIMETATEWTSTDSAEWEPAVVFAEDKARKTEARWMGLPDNYLHKQPWAARGPGRLLPQPREPTKRETGLAQAAAMFKAERGQA